MIQGTFLQQERFCEAYKLMSIINSEIVYPRASEAIRGNVSIGDDKVGNRTYGSANASKA